MTEARCSDRCSDVRQVAGTLAWHENCFAFQQGISMNLAASRDASGLPRAFLAVLQHHASLLDKELNVRRKEFGKEDSFLKSNVSS